MPGVATAVELVDSLERSCPDAIRLAKQLSLAVSIEPALLRRARIEARPSMDVSVESILWFSSLVESRSLNGIALYPEVAAFLRETLVRESGEALVRSKPSLVESARKIVYQAHRSAPATIRLHEELIWLELTVRDEGGVALEGLLMDALVRLLSDSARNASIARWISASGVELPDAVRHTSTFQALDVLSAAVLRREGPSKLSASASGAFIDVPRRYLDKMSRTTLWVAITSDAFVIQSTSAPGFQPVPAPRTNPVLVEVAIDEEGFKPFASYTDKPLWIPFSGNYVTLQTLNGSRFRFRRRYDKSSARRQKPNVGGLPEWIPSGVSVAPPITPLPWMTPPQRMSSTITIDREIPVQNHSVFPPSSRIDLKLPHTIYALVDDSKSPLTEL